VLDRQVAIKLLRNDLGLSGEHQRQLFERMRQEARASARVSHPNIVALFDMGEDDNHGLFLVFEYVVGTTLKDRILTGPLAPAAAARMAIELGEALSTAHAAGVLHRDIKPDNIILAPTGGKIADFGIARLPESTLTRDGRLLGTPAYSSPEAISHGVFSPRSDQFSLAATLYEAVSQTRAFPGDDAIRVASLITTTQAAPIAQRCGLDEMVDVVLQRGMHKDPKARYASCAEFGNALSLALVGANQTLFQDRVYPNIPAIAERDIGTKTLRIIAGAGTFGAIAMAAVLQLTRGCHHDVENLESDSTSSAEPAASAHYAQPRKSPRPGSPLTSASGNRDRPAPASSNISANAPTTRGRTQE
ncbi:MAG TPA: serine/threonine-protein kinase, partial [Polyangiaceae bacterium]